jgi:ABC-type transport system substrate-binding protein
MMVAEIPTISLYYNSVNTVTAPNVEGFSTWPAENPIGWGVSKK